MLGKLIKALTGPRLSKDLRYEEAREVLERDNRSSARALAAREDAPPETLYYLANAEDVTTRRRIAANPSTPVQANLLLADDRDDEVRLELAAKIGRLLPHLAPEEVKKTRELTIQLIEKLARDQLPKVRALVAEEIKASENVPRAIVHALAHDPELEVAAPILEYSPLLTDADLLEIIAAAHIEGIIERIARRRPVSEDVSDAVVASLEIPAIAALLANPDAKIREQTMDQVAEQAREYAELQEPIVLRKDLSMRTMRRLAEFVAVSLLDAFSGNDGIDESVAAIIRRRTRERIRKGEMEENETDELHAIAAARVQKAAKRGELNDEKLSEAAIAGDRAYLVEALVHLSGVPRVLVEKIFDARTAQSIAALTWKSGLSMRVALDIQKGILKLPAKKLLLPRDGVGYPLSRDELNWQLDYFGIEQKK